MLKTFTSKHLRVIPPPHETKFLSLLRVSIQRNSFIYPILRSSSALATHVRIRPSTAAASIIPARTCFNFDASNKDEISFKRGSKVIVKSKPCIDDEYVLIEVDHREGYAPKRFLQPCGSAPQIINNSELVRAETLIGAGTFAKVYEVTYRGKVSEPVLSIR